MPHTNADTKDCVCHTPNGKRGVDPLHVLSCPKVKKLEVNLRHDMVKTIIHRWASRVGCSSLLEPLTNSGSQERGDVFIATPEGKAYMTDVSIVQPTAPSWLKRHTDTKKLVAAEHTATRKRNMYGRKAKDMGAVFKPIALEAFGGFHSDAFGLFIELAKFANQPSCPWTPWEAEVSLVSSVAVAIQIGNMRVIDRVHQQNGIAGIRNYVPSGSGAVAQAPDHPVLPEDNPQPADDEFPDVFEGEEDDNPPEDAAASAAEPQHAFASGADLEAIDSEPDHFGSARKSPVAERRQMQGPSVVESRLPSPADQVQELPAYH